MSQAAAPQAFAGRLVNKPDFERLLGTRWCKRSTHFALHHVAGTPSTAGKRHPGPQPALLSTGWEPVSGQAVDESASRRWFGCVVPKRFARRAVTRNLLKRQARSAFGRHCQALAGGLWLIRLRAPFDRGVFVSARSTALAEAARRELDALLAQAVR